MPASPPSSLGRKSSLSPTGRQIVVDRCAMLRACEPCKRRKQLCNGQRPCTHCTDTGLECIYSVVSEHPRSVFSTNTARRLSSGSACETCRRRKTKCDGGSPCGFCATNGIDCVNNSERRKRALSAHSSSSLSTSMPTKGSMTISARSHSSVMPITPPVTTFPTSVASPSPLSSSLNAHSKPSKLPPVNGAHLHAPASSLATSAPESSDAMDRIEDRLRRIESLMAYYVPASFTHSARSMRGSTSEESDRSSPTPMAQPSRQSWLYSAPEQRDSVSSPVSPPSSPGMPVHTSQATLSSSPQPPTSSMNNLTLSPSSSTSSLSSLQRTPPLATPLPHSSAGWPVSPTLREERKASPSIPSWTDQLSLRTFNVPSLDSSSQYPIYPLSSSPLRPSSA